MKNMMGVAIFTVAYGAMAPITIRCMLMAVQGSSGKTIGAIHMNGKEVFKHAVNYMSESMQIVLKEAGLNVECVRLAGTTSGKYPYYESGCRKIRDS